MHEPRARGKRKLSTVAPTTVYRQLATSSPVDITLPPKRKERMRKAALRCATGPTSKVPPGLVVRVPSERVLDRAMNLCDSNEVSNRHREG